jgi:hypothetical protein
LCLHAFEQPYRHQQTAITSMSATTWRLRKLFLDFTLQRWLVQRVLARARREDISSSASSASPSFHLCALPLTLQPPFYLPIFFSMKHKSPPHHEKPAQVLEICTSADYRHSLARVLALSFSLARALVLSLSFFLSLSSGGKRGGSGSLSFEHYLTQAAAFGRRISLSRWERWIRFQSRESSARQFTILNFVSALSCHTFE